MFLLRHAFVTGKHRFCPLYNPILYLCGNDNIFVIFYALYFSLGKRCFAPWANTSFQDLSRVVELHILNLSCMEWFRACEAPWHDNFIISSPRKKNTFHGRILYSSDPKKLSEAILPSWTWLVVSSWHLFRIGGSNFYRKRLSVSMKQWRYHQKSHQVTELIHPCLQSTVAYTSEPRKIHRDFSSQLCYFMIFLFSSFKNLVLLHDRAYCQ